MKRTCCRKFVRLDQAEHPLHMTLSCSRASQNCGRKTACFIMFEHHSMTCKKMHFVDGVSDRPPRTCDDYMLDSAHAALPVAEWLRFRGSSAQLLAEVMLNSSSIAQTDIDDGLTIQTNGQILGSLGILRARTIELQGGM